MLAFILCERIETFLNKEFHWLVSFLFNRLINFIRGSGEEISHFHNYNNRSTAHYSLIEIKLRLLTPLTSLTNYCHTYNKTLASEAVVCDVLCFSSRYFTKNTPEDIRVFEEESAGELITCLLSWSLVLVQDVFLCFSPRYLTKNTPEDKIFVFLIKILVRKQRFIQKSNGLMSTSCRTPVLLSRVGCHEVL